MAEALTIARPYAEAAFKLAAETKKVKEWSGALSRLATVMKADVATELLDNPNIDRAQAAAIVSEAAGKLDKHQKNFVQVLADSGAPTVPDTASEYAMTAHHSAAPNQATTYNIDIAIKTTAPTCAQNPEGKACSGVCLTGFLPRVVFFFLGITVINYITLII